MGLCYAGAFRKKHSEQGSYRLRRRGSVTKIGCSFVLVFISGRLIDTFLRPWSTDHTSAAISDLVKKAMPILIKGLIHQEDITIITTYCAKCMDSVMSTVCQKNGGTFVFLWYKSLLSNSTLTTCISFSGPNLPDSLPTLAVWLR